MKKDLVSELEKELDALVGTTAATGGLDVEAVARVHRILSQLRVDWRHRDLVPRRPLAWLFGAIAVLDNRSRDCASEELRKAIRTAVCQSTDDALGLLEDCPTQRAIQ